MARRREKAKRAAAGCGQGARPGRSNEPFQSFAGRFGSAAPPLASGAEFETALATRSDPIPRPAVWRSAYGRVMATRPYLPNYTKQADEGAPFGKDGRITATPAALSAQPSAPTRLDAKDRRTTLTRPDPTLRASGREHDRAHDLRGFNNNHQRAASGRHRAACAPYGDARPCLEEFTGAKKKKPGGGLLPFCANRIGGLAVNRVVSDLQSRLIHTQWHDE